jgi:hypothetical protein
MKAIETMATVSPDHTLTAKVPSNIAPGDHQVVVVIDESAMARAPLDLPCHDVGPWPENLSLRREDMYGDWER